MTGPLSARAAYRRGLDTFAAVLPPAGSAQWTARTPCPEWDVRALVNHVTAEDSWVPPLLAGLTITEVGQALTGDLLGDDPQKAWRAARRTAEAAVAATADNPPVALSAGPTPLAEYLWQLAADHLIHAWDLATATGQDLVPDDELTTAVADWFADREDDYRQAGAIAPQMPVAEDASRFDRLLAAFGRVPTNRSAPTEHVSVC